MFLYPDDILEKLDFDNIKSTLSGFCKGQIAKDRCLHMAFFSNLQRVQRMLEEVDECMMAVIERSMIPIGEYHDIKEDLFMLAKENYVLDIESLVKIIGQVRIVAQLIDYASGEEFKERFPQLRSIIDQIEFDTKILKSFDKIFDEDNTIKPDASPELSKISKRIKSKERQIMKEFETLANMYAKQGFLSENKESYRNGRRVLSVQAESKRKIDGIIHDESSSGKTVFIEPQELTLMHNDLYDLESERRQEIYRIVRELCNYLRPYVSAFDLWQKVIVRLDFIQAKAKLAIMMNGSKPAVNNKGIFSLKEAYNPYLLLVNDQADKKTIPFDMEMDRETKILIISGPNAGGKSVTMKAVGIIILMVQCGLLPPVDPDSNIGLPTKLLSDIGDQQSIEDDLSTYSSRLNNMKEFLQVADKNSFILIDEFGSGTDPKVGGALAEAVLHQLHQKHVQGVITTHYSNIKMYGYNTKGIANAAMIFDQKELVPTYKMQQGKPGSSFAFEIANKIGLPKQIVNYAKNKSGKHVKAVDDLLSDLQNERKVLEEKLEKAEKEKQDLQRLLSQYNVLHNEYEFKKKKLKSDIKENNLRKLDLESKELKKLIKELRKEKNLEVAEQKLEAVKTKREEVHQEIEKIEEQLHKAKEVDYKDLVVGDYVKLKKSGLLGQIVDKQGKKYRLQSGFMTVEALEKDIVPSKFEPIEQTKRKAIKTDLSVNVATLESKLDIRGYRMKEAEAFIVEFMDNAFLGSADVLTVVHGVGSGILKKTLLHKLKDYNGIKKVWSPEDEQGGQGVTYIKI